ncbi:MAG: transposase [Vicingaceae bacterium]|nr:transposase [Vicingaceae bacterium]
MLRNKDTTIVSEIKDFFTTREKAIQTILTVMSSLNLTEQQFGIENKNNQTYKNINKLLLLVLFPFFEVKDAWSYHQSCLYPLLSCGKDVFYRLLNDTNIAWREISYKITIRLIKKVEAKNKSVAINPRCLIVDDTDLPKTGRRIELIGKVFSHVSRQSILAFKGLFLGYHDGKSFFALDFSLHGEKGKNKKKPYGMTQKQLKSRYAKQRDKHTYGGIRKQEYFNSKIQQMIEMIRMAIGKGVRFDYLLVDSWFTCYEVIKFVRTRKIKCHLLGMAKMGNTKYVFNDKKCSAKEIVDYQRRTKKVKYSNTLRCYYSETVVDFNGIAVKLFFSKTSRKGKWNVLLSTNVTLKFEEAYKIYAIRWSIEVFFKESKQYLGLGKAQSQDFDAQIAQSSLSMIQYNLLAVAKRFTDYETLGELFRNTKAETLQLTVADKIWAIIIDVVAVLAEFLEIEAESLMEKLITDNEKFMKLTKFNNRLTAA